MGFLICTFPLFISGSFGLTLLFYFCTCFSALLWCTNLKQSSLSKYCFGLHSGAFCLCGFQFISYPLCSRRVSIPLPTTPFSLVQLCLQATPFVPGEFLHPNPPPLFLLSQYVCKLPPLFQESFYTPTHHPTTPTCLQATPFIPGEFLHPYHHPTTPFLVSQYVCKLPPLFQESFYTPTTTPPPFSCVPICLQATPFIPGEFLHPYHHPTTPFSLVPICLQATPFTPGEFLHPYHQPTTPFLVSQYVCKLPPFTQPFITKLCLFIPTIPTPCFLNPTAPAESFSFYCIQFGHFPHPSFINY